MAIRLSKRLVVKQNELLPTRAQVQALDPLSFRPIPSPLLELVQSTHLLFLDLQRNLKTIPLVSQILGLLKALKDYQSQVHRKNLSIRSHLTLQVGMMAKIGALFMLIYV